MDAVGEWHGPWCSSGTAWTPWASGTVRGFPVERRPGCGGECGWAVRRLGAAGGDLRTPRTPPDAAGERGTDDGGATVGADELGRAVVALEGRVVDDHLGV